uniref:nucleoside triphosphate hydrolase n=1 Tax=Marinobacterium profundum TaxID=1714300 RepID=UPI000832ADBC|nr:nucleoside triphosphate hydrolase [Marinobacterium profundum]
MPTATPADLASLINRVLAINPKGRRTLIALSGAPASGKSTLAQQLTAAINAQSPCAALVPMDGFHLDNAILQQRDLLPRKGAPETFDAQGFVQLVQRLGSEAEVFVPLFDRSRDIAIAGAARVGPEHRILIVEGNYLLFDEQPWSQLCSYWDLSIQLNVPLAMLELRLIQRWRDQGLSESAARQRALNNDIPNARRIIQQALPADLVL